MKQVAVNECAAQTCHPHGKGGEVLLVAPADDVRVAIPGVDVPGDVDLGDLLLLGILLPEGLFASWRGLPRLSVAVLSARTFVEPVRLGDPCRCGCPDLLRLLLERYMERVIGCEVGLLDLVLAVGVPRDEGNHLHHALVVDNTDLRLYVDLTEVGLILHHGTVQGSGGLPPVYDLEVVDTRDGPLATRPRSELDVRRSGRDAVVVGEETARFRAYSLPDALVNSTGGLQE